MVRDISPLPPPKEKEGVDMSGILDQNVPSIKSTSKKNILNLILQKRTFLSKRNFHNGSNLEYFD